MVKLYVFVLRIFLISSCTLSAVTIPRMTRKVWQRRRQARVCHCWSISLYLTGKVVYQIYFFSFIELFLGRSYLTEHGVRALLQYLPKLQTLNFPGGWLWLLLTKQFSEEFVNKILFGGNLGKVFDMDWEPYFGPHLALENFSHLMTVTSGGVEVLS